MNTNEPVTGHRTQIYLPESLHRNIKEKARKEDVSMAQVIRKIIEKEMQTEKSNKDKNKEKGWNKLFAMAGIAKSSIRDFSIRHDEYLGDALYEEMMEKRKRYRKTRRKKR